MAVVSLKERGFIYEDNFSTGINARWEITPNITSRVVYDGENLSIKHGPSRLYMFLNELTDTKEFIFDMQNNYNPSTDGDVGGLIAYAGDDDFIAIDEYFDLGTGTIQSYPWIRLVREHNYYYAYWSDNGVDWHSLGSSTFDQLGPKVGIFIEGDEGSDLVVEKVRVFKSNIVTVQNLLPGTKVKLVGVDGNVFDIKQCRTHDNKVLFNVSNLPVPFVAKIVIDTGIDELDDNTFMQIYGGDLYHFEVSPSVIFYIDETPYHLNSSIEEFLGYLTKSTASQDCKLTVRNPLPGRFENIQVSLVQHHDTDHWERLVDIADDNNGVPGTWVDSVNISELASGSEHVLWVKLKREYDLANYGTTAVYFGLKIDASYDAL